MSPLVVGPLVVAACAAAWLAVQRAWMAAFPGESPDQDALSGRLGCHGCGECDKNCERPASERPVAEEVP